MYLLTAVLLVLVGILALTVSFLCKEIRGKFSILEKRVYYPNAAGYEFSGSHEFGKLPHMRNFHVSSENGRKFRLTVYLLLGNKLLDPVAFVNSDAEGQAVVSLYVGLKGAALIFEASPPMPLMVTSDEYDQKLTALVTVNPHWFQRGYLVYLTNWIAQKALRL